MPRLVDYIIEDIRDHTENTDFSDTIGIKDSEFLRFLNDAQYRIHALILQQHPNVFQEEKELTVTQNVESYTLPSFTHLKNKITNVEYSHTSQDKDYYPLRRVSIKNRWSGAKGAPCWYIRRSGKILLNPTPSNSTGKLRFTYVKEIPKLDKRRGSISSVTLDSSNNTITTLTLNVSTDSVDTDTLDKFTRLTVVDAEGTIKMRNIRFDSINATTGEVTINSSFSYEDGETIEANDYIVAGANSSTHTILDDSVERYLIAYASAKIFHRDSSADISAQGDELSAMEEDIVRSYAEVSDDIIEIQEIISDDDQWSW